MNKSFSFHPDVQASGSYQKGWGGVGLDDCLNVNACILGLDDIAENILSGYFQLFEKMQYAHLYLAILIARAG